jgi:adenylate kinase
MKIILLGAPGSGKGTQAVNISGLLGIPHISTGDIFRYNIENNTPLGLEVKKYIEKGQLVPDTLTIDIVRERLGREDCSKGFVLDGFPRTINQAEELGSMLESKGTSIDMVINLAVSDEQVVSRMSERRMCRCGATYHLTRKPSSVEGICDRCGSALYIREDDKPETVKKRLDNYHAQTSPLEDYYRGKGILKEVDGSLMPDEVFQLVRRIVMPEGTVG